jgi:hypothetical protein
VQVRVIAEREIRFWPHGQRRSKKVLVRFGAPKSETATDWSVTYEIIGPGSKDKVSHTVWGVDAVQALVGALQLVPVELLGIARAKGGKMTFLGGDELRFAPGPIDTKS